ncbi:MAG: hypothetical protein JW953_19060 [Anaerolineae bacterium]|nr:hypothetical protein [Anaerolineae bacterium]
MNRWGCFGLTLGGLLGLLLAMLFFVWARQVASSPITPPVSVATADVTLFLSERLLSHIATDALQTPSLVDLNAGGQMEVTTRATLGRLKPVVHLGLSLEAQDAQVTSQLHWAQMGFLKIPANWLPPTIIALGARPGETITQQIPPGFEVVGLATTADGLEFRLNWVGPP